MAIDIIRKDRKEIRWLGLPNETRHDLNIMETERAALGKRLAEKRRTLRELAQRQIALRNLISRNGRANPTPAPADSEAPATDKLHLPFVLVNAPRDSRVHCEMLEDRYVLCGSVLIVQNTVFFPV